MARFFVPFELIEGQCYTLPENVVRHIHVRRIRHNEQISLFNGDGSAYLAQINSIEKKEVNVTIEKKEKQTNESPLEIILAQAISSGDRMDFTIQKSVELGVNTIIPVSAQRSVVQLKDTRAEKKVDRWQEIVISACEQSGRNIIPKVSSIISFDKLLKTLPESDVYIMLSPMGNHTLKSIIGAAPFSKICILIGPEGGLSKEEEQSAIDVGFKPILLGARILRTETASLAIISTLQVLFGDFL